MSDEHEIQHGVVTYWNGRYGFIRSDALGPDLFTHVSQLPKGATVERGARVSFKTAPDKRNASKLCAVDVQVR